LARMSNNFLLLTLSKAFLKSTKAICVLILNFLCLSTRIFNVKCKYMSGFVEDMYLFMTGHYFPIPWVTQTAYNTQFKLNKLSQYL